MLLLERPVYDVTIPDRCVKVRERALFKSGRLYKPPIRSMRKPAAGIFILN